MLLEQETVEVVKLSCTGVFLWCVFAYYCSLRETSVISEQLSVRTLKRITFMQGLVRSHSHILQQ